MSLDLIEWLGAHPLWLWMLLALLLLSLQTFRSDLLFTGLTLAAALTALVALVWQGHAYLYLVLFAVLAGVAAAALQRVEAVAQETGTTPPGSPPESSS